MRWLDAVTGRNKRVTNNLDALFLIPSAAITLQTAAGFLPDRHRVRSAIARPAGAAFAQTQEEMSALISDDPRGPPRSRSQGRLRLHVAGGARRPGQPCPTCAPTSAPPSTPAWRPSFDSGLLCSMVTFTAPPGDDSWPSSATDAAPLTHSCPAAPRSATTSPRSACATTSRLSSRWSLTCRKWLALWNAPVCEHPIESLAALRNRSGPRSRAPATSSFRSPATQHPPASTTLWRHCRWPWSWPSTCCPRTTTTWRCLLERVQRCSVKIATTLDDLPSAAEGWPLRGLRRTSGQSQWDFARQVEHALQGPRGVPLRLVVDGGQADDMAGDQTTPWPTRSGEDRCGSSSSSSRRCGRGRRCSCPGGRRPAA